MIEINVKVLIETKEEDPNYCGYGCHWFDDGICVLFNDQPRFDQEKSGKDWKVKGAGFWFFKRSPGCIEASSRRNEKVKDVYGLKDSVLGS